MDHRPVLVAVAALIAILLISTIWVAISYGPDVLTVVSLLVLGVIGIGVFGALREPPR